ncbi:MAG: hypothetical protein ACK501_02705 [Planctomycetota bacterium]|jgi:hypothetical protein
MQATAELALSVLLLAAGALAQTTHLVGPGGLAQIRDALLIAAPGDLVLAQPGTYAQFHCERRRDDPRRGAGHRRRGLRRIGVVPRLQQRSILSRRRVAHAHHTSGRADRALRRARVRGVAEPVLRQPRRARGR